jgi:hypothetical protein
LNLDHTLDRLEGDAKRDTAGANAALTRLRELELTTSDERARANYIRFKAYLTLSDENKACTSIKAAITDAVDPILKQKYTENAAGC